MTGFGFTLTKQNLFTTYAVVVCSSRKTCRIRLVAKGKSRVQTRTFRRRKLVKIDFITTSGAVHKWHFHIGKKGQDSDACGSLK